MFSSGCCHHIICGTFVSTPSSTNELMACVAFPAHDYALPMLFSTSSSHSLSLFLCLFALSLLLLLYCVSVGFFFLSPFPFSSLSVQVYLGKSLLEVSVEFVGFISLHLLLPYYSFAVFLVLSLSSSFSLCIDKHLLL